MTTTTAIVLGVILAADAAALLLLCKEVHVLVRRRLGERRVHRNLHRLDRELNPGVELGRATSDERRSNTAEAEERALCHELMSGTLDPATYRERMTALAHPASRTGAAR